MKIRHLLWSGFTAALSVAAILPMTPVRVSAGELNAVYSFCSLSRCKDGATPDGLSADHAGNLFGATQYRGGGTIFELVNGKDYRLVYHFVCAKDACTDGEVPNGSLVIDTQGNLYGTASAGGTGGSAYTSHGTASSRASRAE